MPSKSPAQARLMQAAAHDPEFARKVGVPVSVAREFYEADKGKHSQAVKDVAAALVKRRQHG